jgi:hypothetical protein
MMRTQVGGKYHPADSSVFRVKRELTGLGVHVSHPIADEIRVSSSERSLAFDPTAQSFHDVETHYYDCIRRCDFHTVCNRFQTNLGYLGESASLEMAYAMCHRRPILLLHPAVMTDSVDDFVRQFLLERISLITTHDLLAHDNHVNATTLAALVAETYDYRVRESEYQQIDSRIDELLTGLKAEYVAP